MCRISLNIIKYENAVVWYVFIEDLCCVFKKNIYLTAETRQICDPRFNVALIIIVSDKRLNFVLIYFSNLRSKKCDYFC